MNFPALLALIRKDLIVFFADRKSLIVTLAVPIALASFMALLFGGLANKSDSGNDNQDIDVLLVNQDTSDVSTSLIKAVDDAGTIHFIPRDDLSAAREEVRSGKAIAALIIPPGFGKAAPSAMFGAVDAPELTILHDPSRSMEAQVVQGALMQSGMETVSREAFSPARWKDTLHSNLDRVNASTRLSTPAKTAFRGLFDNLDKLQALNDDTADGASTQPATDSPDTDKPALSKGGMRAPFKLASEAVTAPPRSGTSAVSPRIATVSHTFVGMGIQGVLFFAIESALSMIRDRNRGVWKRLRASPASKLTLLGSRLLSSAIISAFVLGAVLTFGIVVFKMQIAGSFLGFLCVSLATCTMVAGLALLIATLGRNEQQSRGISIFVVLTMSMLGGAWMPSFLMPHFLQGISKSLPSRWAIDGLDLTTWRGGSFTETLLPVAVLLAFSLAFAGLSLLKFRWEE